MADMIICGLSMEMEAAREMGTVGKCKGCHYFQQSGEMYCDKKQERLKKEKENCKDWLVYHW